MNHFRIIFPLMVFLATSRLTAADLIPQIPRLIPPDGIRLPDDEQTRLKSELAQLQRRLAAVPDNPQLPDVEVLAKAVEFALRHNEFYSPKDVDKADAILKLAGERLDQLLAGESPWCTARGLVVRGYRSEIDGSAQPYGLEIPETLDLSRPVPLYVWLHGRGDTSTDLHFIYERLHRHGQIAPAGAIVLHPFGRHCIGFKSAGEIDVLDAVQHVAEQYPIDRDRIVLMGFSMGGAGAWHVGAHYATNWCAVSPGAGFVETARYTNLKPADYPPSYEQMLWGTYDVPDYARNLLNIPVVAYSGENDKQIQAARVMEEAFAANGAKLTHIIGPGMGHQYHPDSLREIMRRMNDAVVAGRDDDPQQVSLQTRTLRYNRQAWVEVLGLERHWQDSRVDARVDDGNGLTVTTKNVMALRLHGWEDRAGTKITIDGQSSNVPSDASTTRPQVLVQADGKWAWSNEDASPITTATALRKRHRQQGPIDDAFLAPFLVVAPTGKSKNDRVQQWVEFELQHFADRWRALFRGELRLKDDVAVTADDLNKYNLILWGDADSNRIIRQAMVSLPLDWNETTLRVGQQRYDSATHVPLLIYPSPFAAARYLVLNSGPTFREAHDRTNALQNPKLPDWAVIDIMQPPDATTPGRVVAADFFDERWQLRGR